ncbi:hypothetical protein TBR22_A23390 [Luteitalea sp. TBR-22]|uniref:hypothetical protein n=1 Tax=Luteitalea sp. TBR-22 TaxID=2802971 RepID=UPI001AF649FB|nr:hypothetical protein [Luteitalea sp. TBR-22]BCS33113.1 hypothetical protein TBR22_A23390 [Luteitalea sp. TBR-22]
MLASVVALATPVITLLLLAAVGLDVRVADLAAIRQRPLLVVSGLALPVLAMPLLAWGLTRLLNPGAAVAGGLLLLSICPTGGLSTTYSLLARANAALAVTLAAVACVAAIVSIPLASAGLELLTGDGGPVPAPVGTLVRQVLLVFAPPIVLGMALRARWPVEAVRLLPVVQRAGFALLAVLMALVLADAASRPAVPWRAAITTMAAFVSLSFVIGIACARLLAAPADDRFVLGAVFATRNVAAALAVALALGRQAEFLWVAFVYLLVQIPLLSVAAAVRARLSSA